MLEVAARGRLKLRREPLPRAGGPLLYLSDLHLTAWHGHVVDQVLELASRVAPKLVLLGGDLVDLPSGLAPLSRLVQGLRAPVRAVPGNHDPLVGLDAIERALGTPWLERCRLGELTVDGVLHDPPGDVLCAHHPTVFPRAVRSGYRLVLAGHLHGSQFVLAERRGLLYPGAWFYRWNGDRFEQGGSTLLVSRGVNDTLPLRWNCPRDVICLEDP